MTSVPVEPRITKYLYRKSAMEGVPLSGTFELTPLCNMNCKMCYVRLTESQQASIGPLRTADEWVKLGKTLKGEGMLYLLLTGGEPFSHPEFRKIMEGLHKEGFLISINSNGTLIDEEVVEWLKKVPPVRINISLYGVSDEAYLRLCGKPDGFTKVKNAIRLLKNAGIGIKLNSSITPANVDQIDGMFKFANENELLLQTAAYMFPPIRKNPFKKGENFRLSPEEAAYYTAYSEYLTLGEERFVSAAENLILPSDIEENCSDIGEGIGCRAGKCSFWVTWRGNLLPCGMFPDKGENNVFEKDFLECWERIKQETKLVKLPAKCSGCSLKKTCRACAAMVITESGDFGAVPEYRCKMSKAYPLEYKKLVNKVKEGNKNDKK